MDQSYVEFVREGAALRRSMGMPRWEPARPWAKGYPTHRRPAVRIRTYQRAGGDHRRRLLPTEDVLRRLIVGELRDDGVRRASTSSGVYRTRIRALIAMLAGTGCAPSVVLRLGMRDLLRFEMPKFLWEPVVQWLAIRHRRGLRDGLVFCALHRPQLGLALTCDGMRQRFLRHQVVLLGSTIYTLSGIAAMHTGLLNGRRTMPLVPYLVRHMRRCEPRKELAHYLFELQGRLAAHPAT